MAPDSIAKFRCWSTENVARTVFSDIGALASDADAIFLAAHTPSELGHRKGPEVSGSGETQVLEALTTRMGDVERNTLIAVTGASGSGKSHVVRWVNAHLPSDDSRFHVMYIPRAIQTLRELLRRIIDGLPGVQGDSLMSRVDAAISNVKPGELQDRLVNEMQIALAWTLEDQGPYDGETPDQAAAREDRNQMLGIRDVETGGRRDGIADLLDVPQVKAALLRPDGHLSNLVLSYFDETSRRDAHDEIFTRDDLPVRERGMRAALVGRKDLRELWELISREPHDALRLLEEALRVALPKTVGLRAAGGDTLDSLFRDSRKALRRQDKDLVLIFEDLAQFGMVDGELYDQFVTQPGEDLAPLRVVFAVTDGAYARMAQTVHTRVDYEFHVGGSALSDNEVFVGRYLNLVRVGREATQRLWKPGLSLKTGANWMANACDTRDEGRPCRFRDECHSAFGFVAIDGLGEVGLYPYNKVALRRAMSHLGQDPTPRDVLDECLTTNLIEADFHIGAGDYPHERTRELFDFSVHTFKETLLARNPSPEPERTYRALVIWGDEAPLPAGVLEAFSLTVEPGPGPGPDPKPPPPPPPVVLRPTPLQTLFQWQNGEDLPEDDINFYRDTLRQLTFDRVQLDTSLIHVHSGLGKELLDSLFNRTSFVIEGARGRQAGPQSVRFELTRSAEDLRVMAAARWFRDHGHFEPSKGTWSWPEGFDPAQLMVGLESRLDGWADEVRALFLERTGGARLAQWAVGVRAVALMATGRSQSGLQTTGGVLDPPTEPLTAPSDAWAAVDAVAAGVVSSLRAHEYVGEFAAVRQGETGQPQLIDPRALDKAIQNFIDDPLTSLGLVSDGDIDPVLAQHARRLQEAIVSAAAEEAEGFATASTVVSTLLDDATPSAVGAAAGDVGLFARDSGFFRPTNQWEAFRGAVDSLSTSAQLPASIGFMSDPGAVVRGQRISREVNRMARDLQLIKHVMDETKKECVRGNPAGTDVSALRTQVKTQVGDLKRLVASLGPEEVS